ncbi:MAG: hypothetical protein ACJA1Z_003898 [Patiriisocius sp.]|jgi:hypothetical protein
MSSKQNHRWKGICRTVYKIITWHLNALKVQEIALFFKLLLVTCREMVFEKKLIIFTNTAKIVMKSKTLFLGQINDI